MKKTMRRFLAAVAASIGFVVSGANGVQDELRWRPAVDLILSAFQTRPIVALSEGTGHGQTATRNFFGALIHDTRFRSTARNIVIEFGNARCQAVIDRYVAGDPVTLSELRHVWEDTTQVSGIWSLPMYREMLAEVRSVNAGLSPAQRIRILLGDPPIDWTTVIGPADEDMNDWRDAHFAHVIEREVMHRKEKALILIGGAHISRNVIFPNSLIHLLDSRFPDQTWVVGALDPDQADADIRTRLQPGTLPAGVSVRRTWLGQVDARRIGFTLSRAGVVEDDVDALIVLPAASSRSSELPVLDAAYRAELTRRRDLANSTLPFRGAKIRFEDGVAAFDSDADEPLHAVLREVERDERLRLLVKAFADRAEFDAGALSTRRAELVVDWLARRGVSRGRLVARGCGARRPLNFGNTAAERAMNRRAELVRLTATAGCEPPW
jgi:outer membrane protein OmpA-like peptidoglycan-associated protein